MSIEHANLYVTAPRAFVSLPWAPANVWGLPPGSVEVFPNDNALYLTVSIGSAPVASQLFLDGTVGFLGYPASGPAPPSGMYTFSVGGVQVTAQIPRAPSGLGQAIGGGTAAHRAAHRASWAAWQVALVAVGGAVALLLLALLVYFLMQRSARVSA